MKPRRRVEKREYWTCANPAHRHQKPTTAVRCIVRTELKREFTFAECIEIEQQHDAGEPYYAIAKKLGVSTERIRLEYYGWLRWQEEMNGTHLRRAPRPQWEHYSVTQNGEDILHIVRPDASGTRFACQCKRVPFAHRYAIAKYWRALRKGSFAFRNAVPAVR